MSTLLVLTRDQGVCLHSLLRMRAKCCSGGTRQQLLPTEFTVMAPSRMLGAKWCRAAACLPQDCEGQAREHDTLTLHGCSADWLTVAVHHCVLRSVARRWTADIARLRPAASAPG
jgi:hypothetical protein